jgi:triosephosphate isomerase
MKKIILNHKSYLLYDEVLEYKKELNRIKSDEYEIVVFPQLVYMSVFSLSRHLLGAQDFYSSNMGSFTGEVNLESLKSLRVKYTMISQYERVKILNESKEDCREKLYKSLNSKFNTLLCIGEDKRVERPFYTIKGKINYYLKNVDKSKLKYLSIVYEPSYSIRNANIKDIKYLEELIIRIKNYIKSRYNIKVEVYYAGLINAENFKQIINICDGVVLGKKSTDIEFLKEIVKS